MTKFVYSLNGEDYDETPHDSREEALAYAREAYTTEVWEEDQNSSHIVYTGSIKPIAIEDICRNTSLGSWLISQFQEDAQEILGVDDDSWLSTTPILHVTNLGDALIQAFKVWLERYKYTPDFYTIEAVEMHPAMTKKKQ